MRLFFWNKSKYKRNSGTIAKERLTLLLEAERMQCSPNLLIMLKNDIIQTAGKYVTFNEQLVSVTYNKASDVVTACLPLVHNTANSYLSKRNQNTNVKII